MGEVKNILIEGNNIHDVLGSKNTHLNMIQLWSSNAKSPNENITIRGNTLDAGDSTAISKCTATCTILRSYFWRTDKTLRRKSDKYVI